MKKIIIRTPNFIGDTINTTPCIQLIKQEYPDAQIIIVCPDLVKDVFKYDFRITGFITYPIKKRNKWSTYWHIIKEAGRQKADLGILFTNTFISALLFKLARVKCIVGYKNEGRGFLLDFKPKINRNKHYINHYASLFNEFVGNKYTYLPELYLPISNKETFKFDNGQKTIGFYPGGKHKGDRHYPEQHAIELIRLMHNSGYNIVLIGDATDAKCHAEYLQKANCDNIIDLTGKTNIEDFFNTIAALDLLVTIDSAAIHIAAAVKTPFIGLMGLSTSPTSAITPKVTLGRTIKIENNLIREEDYMKNITPEIVIRNIQDFLADKHSIL